MANGKQRQALAVADAARRAGQVALFGLAGRTVASLEKEAAAIHASERERRERSSRLVSSADTFHALITHGNTTFQFENGSFAVTTRD